VRPTWIQPTTTMRLDCYGDETADEERHCASRWQGSVDADAMARWDDAASGELLSRYSH